MGGKAKDSEIPIHHKQRASPFSPGLPCGSVEMTFSDALKEAEKYRDYLFWELKIESTKALLLSSSYVYCLYMGKQNLIIEEALKEASK